MANSTIADDPSISTFHKIDMWITGLLSAVIIGLYYLGTVFPSPQVVVTLPLNMVMHGPIILDKAPISERKELLCNPHYSDFLNSSSLFQNAADGQRKVQCKGCLALPKVKNLLAELNATVDGRSTVVMGIFLTKICELQWSSLYVVGCISYDQIKKKCLPDGKCGTNQNLCWWRLLFITTALWSIIVIFLFLGLLCFCLLMFDPPPARLGWFARPTVALALFSVAGMMGVVCLSQTVALAAKYGNVAVYYKAFPGYNYQMGSGYKSLVVTTVACIPCLVILIYIIVYTPRYPRHRSRLELRRVRFLAKLKGLKQNTHLV